MSARPDRAVERVAASAARECSARSVRVGWWIYSYGAASGSWAQVAAVVALPDGRLRFDLRGPGRQSVVTAPSYPATYLTAQTARRVGLAGGGR